VNNSSSRCPGRRRPRLLMLSLYYSVMWAEGGGKEVKGLESKDGAVATRQRTRLDGDSPQ
jgi:hypothetical protein